MYERLEKLRFDFSVEYDKEELFQGITLYPNFFNFQELQVRFDINQKTKSTIVELRRNADKRATIHMIERSFAMHVWQTDNLIIL
uniref:CYTH domain-containing protein n=1 Tax=Caenorhabditis tropicalis TaxID=1561998 RepID=A0A1I7T707_9PELO